MIAAESPCVTAAKIAVIAAAPFCDVVKDCGDIKDPWSIEVRHQLAAQRVFVRVLGEREPTQVAQHLQNVLIHRVDMKQVVLHLSDDATEHRQIPAKHRQVVHAAQLVQHALRLLQ